MNAVASIARITHRLDPLSALLATFPAATPELLKDRALLSRIDSKFVVPLADLEDVLIALGDQYAVLRVERGPVATYESLYFDTPSLQCYHDHRRGKRIRHKVRIRHYPDRRCSFLEVKTKRHADLTVKKRHEVPFGEERLGAPELAFLRQHVGSIADELRPELTILYRRLSLIGLDTDERVTIDMGLSADGDRGALVARQLGHLAIVEVKQWPFNTRTPVMRALRALHARPMSLSKYATALALTRPDLSRNRFLPALRALERI